ncbi:MAG: rhodanese-like domain-containing protein [Ornithinimicrobium sp.]|uniref:rhodanese-like domain-containing protein n=1 Tax=Ornithinimicrobium sp. TaxID=1977084 RepID=UPI003D9B2FE9
MNAARRLLYSTAALTTAVLLIAGCAATTPEAAPPTASATAARQLGPEAFAAEIDGGDRFVVNVHTPDEGGIDGTDADIPFDRLEERAAELPQDRDAAIAVYCMTGGMSETAVDTLAGMGYVDLVELRGGMVAWEADGRPLIPPAPDQGSAESGRES